MIRENKLNHLRCDPWLDKAVFCSTENANKVSAPDFLACRAGVVPGEFTWRQMICKIVTHFVPKNPTGGTNARSYIANRKLDTDNACRYTYQEMVYFIE